MNNKIITIKNKLNQLSNKQLTEHSQKYAPYNASLCHRKISKR